jgi:hypothetical protein
MRNPYTDEFFHEMTSDRVSELATTPEGVAKLRDWFCEAVRELHTRHRDIRSACNILGLDATIPALCTDTMHALDSMWEILHAVDMAGLRRSIGQSQSAITGMLALAFKDEDPILAKSIAGNLAKAGGV